MKINGKYTPINSLSQLAAFRLQLIIPQWIAHSHESDHARLLPGETTMRRLLPLAAVTLAGCASASTIPLSKTSFEIVSVAAPVCGVSGAQKVAMGQAAVETLRRGYDAFTIKATDRQQYEEGRNTQGLTVKMFKDGDPAGAEAISAREALGPGWRERMTAPVYTCT